jgi:Fe2+ or Zn2+ uptake regulation protein
MDFIVNIPCPECKNNVIHRYECTCGTKWYCKDSSHTFFWCTHCKKIPDVSFDDMPHDTLKSREEREMEMKRAGIPLEDETKEVHELEKIFSKWG